MAVNLAKKYGKQIEQVYSLGSLTKAAFGAKYDFIGVNTAAIYTLTSQALTDYTRTGANRYGTPAELQDTVNEYTISKDRSFAITVDKGNYIQQNLVKTTGAVIKNQMMEQLFPEQDTYNMTVLAAAALAESQVATAAITASNAYSSFLDGTVALDNAKVPRKGRIAFVSPAFYKFIKLDNSFIKSSELGMKTLINGQVGEVDGVKIVMLPTSYLPANTAFILTHPSAGAAPMQLEDVNTHENPPGISGALIEGRFIYDSFILVPKRKAAYQHKIA
jgi:N4-gp56 family major capsid protein